MKKSWIALLLAVTLIVTIGSMVFAQDGSGEPGDCTVTISVRDTEGNLVSSSVSFDKEAWVRVEWDEWWLEEGQHRSEEKETLNGVADFILKQETHYNVDVLIDKDGHHYRGHADFHTDKNLTMDVTVYVLMDHEVDVYFNVSGPVGVRLEIDEDEFHGRWIPMGATAFDPVSFRVEVYNADANEEDVKITAHAIEGDWQGNLVGVGPDQGQIAFKSYAFNWDDGEWNYSHPDDWEIIDYFSPADGFGLTAVRPGDVGHLEGKFIIKGYVGENTVERGGRIIFKAELVNP